MNQITDHEDYVHLGIAQALKILGFNWECNHYYCPGENGNNEFISSHDTIYPGEVVGQYIITPESLMDDWNSTEDCCSAPTLYVAQKWIREIKGLDLYVLPTIVEYGEIKYRWIIRRPEGWKLNVGEEQYEAKPEEYSDTYEDSLSNGLCKCLALLILKK